jgi:hypothetical protein
VEVFEDELRDLVYVDLGLEVLAAGLIAGLIALSGPLPSLLLAPDDVADLRVAVALRDVLLLAIVEPELVLVELADRNLHAALAIRQDERFVGDDRPEVLLDRLADALLVAILVDLPFALKAPVVAMNRHKRLLVASCWLLVIGG